MTSLFAFLAIPLKYFTLRLAQLSQHIGRD